MVQHGVRDLAHQADRAAAEHQADPVLAHDLAERARGNDERRIAAGARPAVNADFFDGCHDSYIETLAGNLKAASVLLPEISYMSAGLTVPRPAARQLPGWR